MGKIIIIVAPSGTGKSTLIKRIKQAYPMINESVSFTTRKARPGEVDGAHYQFINDKKFDQMVLDDEFLEHANVHGKKYGTSKKSVEKAMDSGEILLFDLDVQGTDSFKKIFKERANAIFIAPPSYEELERRLRDRGTESEKALSTRLTNAKKELKRMNDYDYLVINDDIDQAYEDIYKIVGELVKDS